MAYTFESRLFRELAERVEAEILLKSDGIITGALADYPAYQKLCGEVRGMRSVLSMARDLEKKLNGEKG